jgi:hypothetical protein
MPASRWAVVLIGDSFPPKHLIPGRVHYTNRKRLSRSDLSRWKSGTPIVHKMFGRRCFAVARKRRGLGPRRSSSGLLLVQSATPFEAHFAFEALFVVRALLAVGALGCRLATSIVTAHVAFAALLVLHALVAIGWALGRGLTTSIVTAHVAFAALLVLHALVAIGWALGRFPASVLRMGDALAVAATTDARDVT